MGSWWRWLLRMHMMPSDEKEWLSRVAENHKQRQKNINGKQPFRTEVDARKW